MASQGLPFAVQVAIRARDHQGRLSLQQTLMIELMDQPRRKKLYLEVTGDEFDELQYRPSLTVKHLLKRIMQLRKLFRLEPQYLVELALAGTGCTELLESSLAMKPVGQFSYNDLGFAAMYNGQWETLERLLQLSAPLFDIPPIKLETMMNVSIEDGRLDRVQNLSRYTFVYDSRRYYMLGRLGQVPPKCLELLQYLLKSYPVEDSAVKNKHMVKLAQEQLSRLQHGLWNADLEQLKFLLQQIKNSGDIGYIAKGVRLEQALLELGGTH